MTESVAEILLVEDNEDDARLAIRALRNQSFANKLLHLNDGVEALDFLFATGTFEGRNVLHTPKVVLLDLKMPRINGLEVLERIKSDERTKIIPVVILTSSSEDPDIRRAYELGANSYIVKPVEFDNFVKAISELGLYWMLLNK
ncbi:response regulator [Parachryseolinea silvisoli]|jgi:two-component system, response regulator|uniref:response regulator n=1 Tax=Parachryseolinea silvisoli TaxID=2873601 RepID=UPI002265E3A4|nr:response regulator [Parachryseolinea silvisoli]MCD9013997.1 response regulator [Parachryseolinea silvisoli]